MKLTPEQRKVFVALGKLGGPARAKALTKERRREIAQMGGRAPRRKKNSDVA